MAKFMVLYRSPVSAEEQMAGATPEQAQAGLDAWNAWGAKAGDSLVDFGTPAPRPVSSGQAELGEWRGLHRGVFGPGGRFGGQLRPLLDDHPHLMMARVRRSRFSSTCPTPGM